MQARNWKWLQWSKWLQWTGEPSKQHVNRENKWCYSLQKRLANTLHKQRKSKYNAGKSLETATKQAIKANRQAKQHANRENNQCKSEQKKSGKCVAYKIGMSKWNTGKGFNFNSIVAQLWSQPRMVSTCCTDNITPAATQCSHSYLIILLSRRCWSNATSCLIIIVIHFISCLPLLTAIINSFLCFPYLMLLSYLIVDVVTYIICAMVWL